MIEGGDEDALSLLINSITKFLFAGRHGETISGFAASEL
jgi:hypothetical protein